MWRSATQSLVRRCRPNRFGIARQTRTFATAGDRLSYEVVPKEDFGPYDEYSVIFTNRALNLMSDPFQKVMRDLNDLLKETYQADKVAIIPGYVLLDINQSSMSIFSI